jgi:UPF0042 nucleotide-binding protein
MAAEFLVICGLSGAGRSQAAANLDDQGWFVIDNVPAALIPKVGELAAAPGSTFERVALVVRSGARGPEEVQEALERLATVTGRVRILFLDAPTEVLIRRYESTRRRHPLAEDGIGLGEAIERERELLEPLKAVADVIVDTGGLNVHQLRDRIRGLFGDGDDTATPLRIQVVSFGYKHGLPLDVDLVLDCRFLPNPHWVDELRPLTGLDPRVRDYVLGQPDAVEFLERLEPLLDTLLPAYAREGRTFLSLALGCTGGQHRSVVIAEEVGELLRRHGYAPGITHRDIDHR